MSCDAVVGIVLAMLALVAGTLALVLAKWKRRKQAAAWSHQSTV
jgi:uncharacterized membrane protein